MLKKICGFLSTIILIVLLILAGLLVVPPLIGYQSLAVLSGSMEPNIGVGAIVYTKEVDTSELEIGDIITYKLSGSTLVTHRIVEIDVDNEQVITQGDANDVVDGSPVAYDKIVGRVDFHVPMLGFVSMYIKTPLGIAAICGVVFMLILLTFLPDVFTKKEKEETNK